MTQSNLQDPWATMKEQQTPVLSLNGKNYPIDELPADIQNLLDIYGIWENELKMAKVEVFKLEAAIKGVSFEIEHRIQQFESTPVPPQG